MKNLISKTFLITAAFGMAVSPTVAAAKTRTDSSPIYGSNTALLQTERDSDDRPGDPTRDGYTRDGRTWSAERQVWIDAEGDRWMLSRGKWYPLRDGLIPAFFVTSIVGAFAIAVFSDDDDDDDDNQSPGAN